MPAKTASPTIEKTFHSAAHVRRLPERDVLEEGWLHQLFLITHVLAAWPAWKLALMVLGATALVWYVWLPLGPFSLTAAAIFLGFVLLDWALLLNLPQAGLSYGPVGPQLLVMTTPRLVSAVLLGLVARLAGWHGAAVVPISGLSLIQMLGAAVYVWGALVEPFRLTLTRRKLHSAYLKGASPPIRLLHISDLHIERLTRREAFLLELVAEAKPDLIVITGDYLNLSYVDDPLARSEVRKLLARLHAPLGVYATLGSPPVDPRTTTPSLFEGLEHIRLLRDEVAVLNLPDGRRLSLLGLDCDHALDIDAEVFRALVDLAPADSARILLYHSPELMPLVQQYPVDLYLCGHTHGGQVRLPVFGALLTSSALGKRYEMGLYQEQGTTLYISRGVGLEGLSAPRLRLLCPPEIILWELS
ncbi:MAG: hypothetical protein D6784_05440 [Chloroflexi bacterium]|nr:MAG: hypothetical protein D6784_05440 [Chloroflexota bacterium]